MKIHGVIKSSELHHYAVLCVAHILLFIFGSRLSVSHA